MTKQGLNNAPRSKKVLIIAIVFLLSSTITFSTFFIPQKAQAVVPDWPFTTSSDYIYDDSKIEIIDGKAQLKKQAGTWVTKDQVDFDEGSYSQTQWNTGHLELTSGQSSGDYTSKVYDANVITSFDTISWEGSLPYGEELNPDSNTSALWHLDEGSGTQVSDSSGNNLNGTIHETAWRYRKPITIDNTGNPQTLSDYQVKVKVDYLAGKMNSDFSDLRFYDSGGNSLSYWIESHTPNVKATAWIKVPSVPASSKTTVYMYYGNPSVASASNGDGTFDFFDDFKGSVGNNVDNSPKWVEDDYISSPGDEPPGDVTYQVKDGKTVAYFEDDNNSWRGWKLRSNNSFDPNKYVFEAMIKGFGSGSGDFDGSMGFVDINTGLSCIEEDGGAQAHRISGATGSKYLVFDWRKLNAQYISGDLKSSYDGETLTSSSSHSVASSYVGFEMNNSGNPDLAVDWVFLRKHTSSEPSVSLGSESWVSNWTSGKFGSALRFYGINGYVDCGTSSSLDVDYLSIEAWIKPASFGWYRYIAQTGRDTTPPKGGYALMVDSNKLKGFVYLDSQDSRKWIAGSTSLSQDAWYHVVLTFNGTDLILYVNGKQDKIQNYSSDTIMSPPYSLTIGAHRMGGSPLYIFDGAIDEIAIYNRALSKDEILDHYKRGALSLKFQACSCDDELCDGESFIGPDGTSASYYTNASSEALSLSNNRYSQYKAYFNTENPGLSPELKEVEINQEHYPVDSPTIQPKNSKPFSSISTFQELAIKDGGEIKYILSNNNGGSWLYWDGSSWVESDETYAQANLALEVADHAPDFPVGDGQFLFKAFLHSDGSQQVQLDTVSLSSILEVPADISLSKTVGINVPSSIGRGFSLPASRERNNQQVIAAAVGPVLLDIYKTATNPYLIFLLLSFIIFSVIGALLLFAKEKASFKQRLGYLGNFFVKSDIKSFDSVTARDPTGTYLYPFVRYKKFNRTFKSALFISLALFFIETVVIVAILSFFAHQSPLCLRAAVYDDAGKQIQIQDKLTYRIDYENKNEGEALDLVIQDRIPKGTSFILGSLCADGVMLTDEKDSDLGDFNNTVSDAVSFNIGTVPEGSQGYILFRVQVDDPATVDSVVNQASAAFNPESMTVYSDIVSNPIGAKGVSQDSIGDLVFWDKNKNAIFDSNDEGLEGVEVRLYEDSDQDASLNLQKDKLVDTKTTDSAGFYSFTNLSAKAYIVYVNRTTLSSDFVLTTNNEPLYLVLSENESYLEADFGYAESEVVPGIVPKEKVIYEEIPKVAEGAEPIETKKVLPKEVKIEPTKVARDWTPYWMAILLIVLILQITTILLLIRERKEIRKLRRNV